LEALTIDDFIVSDDAMVRGRSILLMLALATPSLAWAETMSFGDAAAILSKSCGKDIDANCRGVNFDSSRLKDCLSRNQDVVSVQCKADYARSFDAIQKRIAARAAVPRTCERDIVKLCAGDRKEIAKAVECLLAASGVSPKCNQAIGDAGYR
jgi:hypothetical protein